MTEITQQYMYLRACSDDQLCAVELIDNGWRSRNYPYLAQASSATGKLEPLVVKFPDPGLLDYDYLISGLIEIVSERLMDGLREQPGLEFSCSMEATMASHVQAAPCFSCIAQ